MHLQHDARDGGGVLLRQQLQRLEGKVRTRKVCRKKPGQVHYRTGSEAHDALLRPVRTPREQAEVLLRHLAIVGDPSSLPLHSLLHGGVATAYREGDQ